MAPKVKFTKEEVIAAALQLVQERGMDALTARALAARLGSSPKPIFGLFQNMEEVQTQVLEAAKALYQSYLQSSIAQGEYPPIKPAVWPTFSSPGRSRSCFAFCSCATVPRRGRLEKTGKKFVRFST